MARQRESAVPAQMDKSGKKSWASLTWDELNRWTGTRSASRGQAYERQGRVRDLALAEDGRLLAWVMGGDRYAVSVRLAPGHGRSRRLESTCTCPVGFSGCKHAVAVAVAFLHALADGKVVPTADGDDPRWAKLSEEHGPMEDAFEDGFEDEVEFGRNDDAEDIDVPNEHRRHSRLDARPGRGNGGNRGKGSTQAQSDEKIQAHIRRKSHDELADWVWSLVGRFPDLRQEIQEQVALAEGGVSRLVDQARRELDALTGEVGWRNKWDGRGHTPDYTGLKHRLERLAEHGHCDEVVELGSELIRRGIDQVEQSNDEGETAMAISDCLPVVFGALARSTRSAPDKLLYAIDACLQDEYDVIGKAADPVLEDKWSPGDWSVVADRLAHRLKGLPGNSGRDDFSRHYRRDQVSGWLLQALENAGRKEELLAVYEGEARATCSYQRLVRFLIERDRIDDAERWAREGIERTREELPGIATALLESMCELARRRKAWDVVAAHAAREFFERPSVDGFKKLIAAATKARCAEPVRAAALRFLESGRSPVSRSTVKGSAGTAPNPPWPLPVPDYLAPPTESGVRALAEPGPHHDVLLNMAIAQKKPDDVLRWFDKMGAAEAGSPPGGRRWVPSRQSTYAEQVAAAVASSHPERALEIYCRGLEAGLKIADVRAYESCAAYLRKLRPVLKSLGRKEEWGRLLAEIRQQHRNRPRFMEILDTLEGRTILQSRKSRRGR